MGVKPVIMFALAVLSVSTCFARTIYVEDDASGLNDGTSWVNAYKFLQDALTDANSSRDVNEIFVAQGIYKPDADSTKPKGTNDRAASFYLIDGVNITGGYAGLDEEDPNKRDIEAYLTILSGDIGMPSSETDNSYHVVVGEGLSTGAVIDGFTIADGKADGPYPYGYRGGGMFFELGSLTAENCTFKNNHGLEGGAIYKLWKSNFVMKNCTFIGNSSSSYGGGIFNEYGSLTLLNCVFVENSARNNGGGVYNDWSGESRVDNCTFTRNTSGGFGGGLFNGEYFETVITNCSFTDNRANRGGGMGTEGSGDTNTSVIKCNFIANSANEDGGALNLFGGRGLFLINDCNFRENTAGRFGGGIYNQSRNPLLKNCIISGNSSEKDGGGIYNYSSYVILNDCIIRNNTTKGKGGGMCSTNIRNQKLIDCDVSFNFAANGGGIYSDTGYDTDLNNCSIIGNVAEYDGGGVCIYDHETAVIHDCRFEKNDANRYGGGLYNGYFSNSNIENSFFICNSARYGGGIDNCLSDPNVIGCTFTSNTAYSDGGGLRNNGPCNTLLSSCVFTGNKAAGSGGAIHSICESEPFFVNCTFSGNRAKKGGALSSERSSNPIVTNCILWDNAASLGNNICLSFYTWFGRTEATSMTVGYTDIEGGNEGIWIETGCTLNWKEGNIEVDPCFVQEGFWDTNGVWIDGDCHLLDSSLCIDAGDPNQLFEPNETDIDGQIRLFNGRIDIGADEFLPVLEVPLWITPRVINPHSNGKWVKAHISLPKEVNISYVDTKFPLIIEPFDVYSDCILVFERYHSVIELQAIFNRSAICEAALVSGLSEVSVDGMLTNGVRFYGTDTIWILRDNPDYLTDFVSHWLETGCHEPWYCGGADINKDTKVDFLDFSRMVNQ